MKPDVIARLEARGASVIGGVTGKASYVPVLDENGLLDISILPLNTGINKVAHAADQTERTTTLVGLANIVLQDDNHLVYLLQTGTGSSDSDWAVIGIDWLAASSDATEISFAPSGNISATDVQGAIEELDAEKAGLALDNTLTGIVTFDPPTARAAFVLGTNALDVLIPGLNAALLDDELPSYYTDAENTTGGYIPAGHIDDTSHGVLGGGTLHAAATTSAAGFVTLAVSGAATSGAVVQATDSRLSDSRIPSGSAGGALTGTYPSPTLRTPTASIECGNQKLINVLTPTLTTDAATKGYVDGLVPIYGTGLTYSLGTLAVNVGSGANQVVRYDSSAILQCPALTLAGNFIFNGSTWTALNLPTGDPFVVGQVWNSEGFLKVSSGSSSSSSSSSGV